MQARSPSKSATRIHESEHERQRHGSGQREELDIEPVIEQRMALTGAETLFLAPATHQLNFAIPAYLSAFFQVKSLNETYFARLVEFLRVNTQYT